jgi:hypothetical protein
MSAKQAEFEKIMRQQRVYEGGHGLLVQQPSTPELKPPTPEQTLAWVKRRAESMRGKP